MVYGWLGQKDKVRPPGSGAAGLQVVSEHIKILKKSHYLSFSSVFMSSVTTGSTTLVKNTSFTFVSTSGYALRTSMRPLRCEEIKSTNPPTNFNFKF